jgi:flagellar hook protein FlgE
MDVIGNNVANVNTVGFKSGRVTFQEIFSQTLRGAGAPDKTNGRGGTNPMQVGLGLGVGAVDTIMTRGSVQRTDNPTDLAIEGEGFFVVKGSNVDTYKFTRAGNFGIDKLGNLVTGSGMNVFGWQEYKANLDGTYTFDTEKPIGAINLYSDIVNKNKKVISPKVTTGIELAGNLDTAMPALAAATPTSGDEEFIVPVTVYDKLGNAHNITVEFWKSTSTATLSTWKARVQNVAGEYSVAPNNLPDITFDQDGKLTSADTADIVVTPDPTKFGTDNFTIALDFSRMSSFSADNSVKPSNVDGYTTGNLVTFNIGSDGIITGIYSNGQQQPLGMLALATFENAGGMQKVGENLYIPTTNSGDFKKASRAGSNGAGALNPGTLEMSNVDLSREFTDMIITQRGFQANSRIITTSDEMLQELVNLKR